MLEARPLTLDDLQGCFALSAEAGWNQTIDDWRLILSNGEGLGLFADGRLVASAAVVPYGGRFGWICMVLVTESERRKGHATRLMRWACDWLAERGLIAGLDATPAGREVYRRLGFRDVYPLTRWMADRPRVVSADAGQIHTLGERDIDRIAAFDADAFGAERRTLIAALRERMPDMALVAGRNGRIRGYALARDGRLATQIGPVVADGDGTAVALIAAALARVAGPVFIDLADRHGTARRWLQACGFTEQRPFMRMLAGRSDSLDKPDRIVAIAGPELA